jgi:lipopolysaccharide/colanic/teichoic acid biosynthesis glycosyltransferase
MKRAFDIAAALAGIAVLSPLLLLIAVSVRLGSPGPVLFVQERMGKGFRPFGLYKFRTMVRDAASRGPSVTASGDPRVTRVGRVLRRTKLDELPQLFNVLAGHMGIVGPRPEVRKYVEMFAEDYRTVLSVRPGITDYAAIRFRDEEAVLRSYPDPEEAYVREVLPAKIGLYKEYIARGPGLVEDLRIIALTVLRLFR